jgi:hypothetical protein
MAEKDKATVEAEPEAPETKKRKRLPIVPVLIFAAIIGGAVFLLYVRAKPEQGVRRLIDLQLKLSEAQLGNQLYDDTLSLRVKQTCARDDFAGAVSQVAPDFWHLTQYKNLHIKVEGHKAIVTYDIVYNGVIVERATEQDPDIYTLAQKTVLGRLVTVAEGLAAVEALNNAPGGSFFGGPKEYRDARKKVIKEGNHRLVIEKAGSWYDDLDSHTRCG